MPHHLLDQDLLNEERVRQGEPQILGRELKRYAPPPFLGTSLDTSIIYHLKYKYMFMFKERQR